MTEAAADLGRDAAPPDIRPNTGRSTFQPRPVRILRDDIVNQIAAGEVVERPASVVKELIENSIDAGAAEITVIVDNGGGTNIEIIDDGCGMSLQDALIAVQRFGTSKIRELSDLEQIATLGFRGEAIPSIASVSKFRLRTRCRTAETAAAGGTAADSALRQPAPPGIEITIEGGRQSDPLPCETPLGTRIQVRQLFFNVPARRKFLRSERTEAGLIRSVVTDFSLVYPQIRFRLVVDGAESAVFQPAGDFFGRAALLKLGAPEPFVIDRVYASQAAPVPLRIGAVLSKPIAAAPTADRLRLFVNGRLVRDKLLLRAVREGYGNFLKAGTYPAGALLVALADSEVDVNVHPQKTEVRFRTPQAVFGAVSGAIRAALRDLVPLDNRLDPDRGSGFNPESKAEPPVSIHFSGSGFSAAYSASAAGGSQGAFFLQTGSEAAAAPAPGALIDPAAYRYVGQLFELYLVLEGPGGMLLVDMHAAHERVMYVRIKERLLGADLPAQLLLVPEVVQLEIEEVQRFERWAPALARLGIEIERFGEEAVAVRSVPALLKNPDPQKLVRELTAIPDLGPAADPDAPREEIMRRLEAAIARLACHRSIRSGRLLERQEVYALLEELNRVEGSAFCPHGRPVLRLISAGELERTFGR